MNKILQNSTNYRKYTPTSPFTNVSLGGGVGNSFPDRIFDILIVVCDRYRAEGDLLVGSQRSSQAVEAQMQLLLLLLLLGKEYNASGCIVEIIY
jgi:hypothetical protein